MSRMELKICASFDYISVEGGEICQYVLYYSYPIKKNNCSDNQTISVISFWNPVICSKITTCLFVPATDLVMEEGAEVIEDILFRGVEFSVKIELMKGVLVVEISELLTADQWRGEFDPACEYHTPGKCHFSRQ